MVLIVLRGLNGQNNEGVDRCLIKGLRTEKNGGQTPNKKVSEQEMVCDKYESFD